MHVEYHNVCSLFEFKLLIFFKLNMHAFCCIVRITRANLSMQLKVLCQCLLLRIIVTLEIKISIGPLPIGA